MAKKHVTEIKLPVKKEELLDDNTEILEGVDGEYEDDSETIEGEDDDEYDEDETEYDDEDETEEAWDDSEAETDADAEKALLDSRSREPELTSLDKFELDPSHGSASTEDTDKYYKERSLAPHYPQESVPVPIPHNSPVTILASEPPGLVERRERAALERKKRLLSLPSDEQANSWILKNKYHVMCGVQDNTSKRIAYILNAQEQIIGSGPDIKTACWAAGLRVGR